MGYFPMCVDLEGKRVLLVGQGPQIAEKAEKLCPFGAALIRLEALRREDLEPAPVFVIAAGLDPAESMRVSDLCGSRNIPVNVVDDPQNSTFYFPALITRGPLTVSVSTGGTAPGAAACLAGRIRIPDETEQILLWLHDLRAGLYAAYPNERARGILRSVTAQAFELGRCLTKEELERFL